MAVTQMSSDVTKHAPSAKASASVKSVQGFLRCEHNHLNMQGRTVDVYAHNELGCEKLLDVGLVTC